MVQRTFAFMVSEHAEQLSAAVGLQGEVCSVHQAILQRENTGAQRNCGVPPAGGAHVGPVLVAAGSISLPAPPDVSRVRPGTFCPLGL